LLPSFRTLVTAQYLFSAFLSVRELPTKPGGPLMLSREPAPLGLSGSGAGCVMRAP
jgi:hypothetical protein